MAATTYLYDSFHLDRLNGVFNFSSDDFKVALCTSSYTPDRDSHTKFSDITHECAATGGYTSGGVLISSGSVTADTTNHRAYYDGADFVIDPSTITARYAIFYKDTGTPSTSPLIGYIDFGVDQSSSAGSFKIQWSTSGIFESKAV